VAELAGVSLPTVDLWVGRFAEEGGHFCCFCGSGSGALRRVWGRPSQVKGAFGVAARGRCAPPWTCKPLRPRSGRYLRAGRGLPGRVRSAPEPQLAAGLPVKIVE
jgi:hypothetical protein